jgi:hypothetical protein
LTSAGCAGLQQARHQQLDSSSIRNIACSWSVGLIEYWFAAAHNIFFFLKKIINDCDKKNRKGCHTINN